MYNTKAQVKNLQFPLLLCLAAGLLGKGDLAGNLKSLASLLLFTLGSLAVHLGSL